MACYRAIGNHTTDLIVHFSFSSELVCMRYRRSMGHLLPLPSLSTTVSVIDTVPCS